MSMLYKTLRDFCNFYDNGNIYKFRARIDHVNASLREKTGVKKGQFIKYNSKASKKEEKFKKIAKIEFINPDHVDKKPLHTKGDMSIYANDGETIVVK